MAQGRRAAEHSDQQRTESNEDPPHVQPEGQEDDGTEEGHDEQRPLVHRAHGQVLLRAIGLSQCTGGISGAYAALHWQG